MDNRQVKFSQHPILLGEILAAARNIALLTFFRCKSELVCLVERAIKSPFLIAAFLSCSVHSHEC